MPRIDDSSFQSRRFGTTQESGLLHSCSDCFGHLTDGSLNYQLVRPDAPELWALDQHGVVVTRLKGAGAIAEFHKVGRQIAINNSTDDVLFLYAAPQTLRSDGSVDVQIGSQETSINGAEFQLFLDKSLAPAQLTAALNAAQAKTSAAGIIVLSEGEFKRRSDGKPLPGGADSSSTSMAVALKALSETDRDVFVANNAPTALKHLPEFRSSSVKASSDLALYTAKTIRDADIVHNLNPIRTANHLSFMEKEVAIVRECEPGKTEATTGAEPIRPFHQHPLEVVLNERMLQHVPGSVGDQSCLRHRVFV